MIKNYMESDKKFKVFNVFLKIIYYSEIVCCVGLPIGVISYGYLKNISYSMINIIMISLFWIAFISFTIITNQIIKINRTFAEKKPYTIENVKSMKNMAFNLFIIGIYVFIKDRLRFGHRGIFAFKINKYGLYCDMNFLIFIIMCIFMLILAEFFNEAIRIKEENDLTV